MDVADGLISFNGGLIVAGDEMQLIDDAALVICDGRILQIGEQPPPAASVIDVSGKLLCPMFINAHTHVGDTGAKELGVGKSLREAVVPPDGLKHRFLGKLDPEDQVDMMRHALIEMLHNGVIASADFREQGLRGVQVLRRAAEGLPFRAIALGRMDEKASLLEAEEEAHTILEVADGIGIRDATSYDLEMVRRLRNQYPQKLMAAHSSENLNEERLSVRQMGRGQTARHLDWGPDFLVHLVHTPEADLKRLAGMGTIAVSCPRVNGIIGDGFANLGLWHRLGIPFALGTDNVMFNSPDMLREMDMASRLTRGLNGDPTAIETSDILKAATIMGARALKLEADMGSLAPGKEGSFIVFDLYSPNLTYQHDPLSAIVHRATTADIADIYIKGQSLTAYDLRS